MIELPISLFFAALVGFGHAFEADHLLAVSSLVTKRQSMSAAIKDGIYWGLGHTSTIFLVGAVMIVGKSTLLNGRFQYFEALVGLALILLGIHRWYRLYHPQDTHSHEGPIAGRHLAYGVGLVHGLAGSGTMVLLVMNDIEGQIAQMAYLLIFGIGSVVGMLTAAGVLSLPFTKTITTKHTQLRVVLALLSSVLCIAYGAWIILKNLV